MKKNENVSSEETNCQVSTSIFDLHGNKPVDYEPYLGTIFAATPVHGHFVVSPNGQKRPVWGSGTKGIYDFDDRISEAVQTTSPQRFLGRAFGADDGVIGIDCDHWIPPHEWSGGTGYYEISQSRTGAHIIVRIQKDAIPSNVNKIVVKKDSKLHKSLGRLVENCGDIELFLGRGVGIAITGYEAHVGVPDLDPESDAGKIVYTVLSTPKQFSPQPPKSEDPDLGEFIAHTISWACVEKLGQRGSDSEYFAAVTYRIARDLARFEVEHNLACGTVLTPARLREIWEMTPVYRELYQGTEKYADHKIRPTIQSACEAGYALYGVYAAEMDSIRGKQTEKKRTQKKEKPAKRATHPEGFCMDANGVPEFWCNAFPKPLRYDMAHIAKYAQDVMHRPRAVSAWITAVLFASCVCGRQYSAFGGSVFSRIYIIMSGMSGAGKSDIRRALRALEAEIGLKGGKKLIVPNRSWTSDAAVHATIAEYPQSVAVWDECGHKIRQMVNDAIGMGVFTELTEAFSEADGILEAKKYADSPKKGKKDNVPENKMIDVYHPSMSVIGLGTPEQLSAISEEMIEDGRFARWLYFEMPNDPILIPERDPKHPPRLNGETVARIRKILKTATMRPDYQNPRELDQSTGKFVENQLKQAVLKNLDLQSDAPKSWRVLDLEYQHRYVSATSPADRAVFARALEIGGSLALARTLLGTELGTESDEIPYEILQECLAEVDVSINAMHALWSAAPVYTPREQRIAKAANEAFHRLVDPTQPAPRVWKKDLYAALKEEGITMGGHIRLSGRPEQYDVDEILATEYGIAFAREGNSPTGRKYYYLAAQETAQAKQEIYDESLKHKARGY